MISNSPYRGLAYSKFYGELSLWSICCAYFDNSIFGQLMKLMKFASHDTPGRPSAFDNHVAQVFSVSSNPEMFWVNTSRVVARMAYAIRFMFQRTTVHYVANSVSKNWHFETSTSGHHSVAPVVDIASPDPASLWVSVLLDLGKESVNNCWRYLFSSQVFGECWHVDRVVKAASVSR